MICKTLMERVFAKLTFKATLYTANVKFQSVINHLYCKVIVETVKYFYFNFSL